MSCSIHRRSRVLARFLPVFFSGLLVGGLASCSGGTGNSGAPHACPHSRKHPIDGGCSRTAGFPAAGRPGAPAVVRRRSRCRGFPPGSRSPHRRCRLLRVRRCRLRLRRPPRQRLQPLRSRLLPPQWSDSYRAGLAFRSGSGADTPDFSLSVTPAAVTLTANGTPATTSLLATAQNGFSSNVQVTIAGLPAGVTAQPSTITLTPGTAATLTLTAPAGTAAGSSTATLTGTSGSLTHTASLAVTVTAPPPSSRLLACRHPCNPSA